jgi:three-Cys-motif partner protein
MLKKDAKTQLLDHSEAKVRLLSEYLIRYLNIIANSRRTQKIKIYDLFCGEGIYENGGEGSPLVIMRAVKDLHFINVAKINEIPKVDCSFNDINKDKVEKVKQAINDKSLYYPEFGNLEFSSDDYKKVIERVLNELTQFQNQKAFVFIDPYGYKHIKASEIKALLLKENAEVLLFLPTQFMYRFDANGTPEALKDFIEELVDYKNWSETDSVWSFIEQLKEAFGNYLGKDFFVDTFTIQKDPQTVFCLFFFSSHIKGFEKMLEAKWKIDTEQGKGWDYAVDSQQGLFHAQKINPLEEKLKVFLETGSKSNAEIYEFTLRNGFLPMHCVDVFSSWQKNDKLAVESTKGEKVRKGSFYIAYKYFRDEPNKVNFTLK